MTLLRSGTKHVTVEVVVLVTESASVSITAQEKTVLNACQGYTAKIVLSFVTEILHVVGVVSVVLTASVCVTMAFLGFLVIIAIQGCTVLRAGGMSVSLGLCVLLLGAVQHVREAIAV